MVMFLLSLIFLDKYQALSSEQGTPQIIRFNAANWMTSLGQHTLSLFHIVLISTELQRATEYLQHIQVWSASAE